MYVLLAATVKFKEAGCNVSESVGSVEHVLVLSKPLSMDAIIEVIIKHGTTTRELLPKLYSSIHTCMHIVLRLSILCKNITFSSFLNFQKFSTTSADVVRIYLTAFNFTIIIVLNNLIGYLTTFSH